MVDEIEHHREGVPAVRQRPRGKTPCGDLQRHRPAVIQRRRLRERNLADDCDHLCSVA
jgi:hypothetical protein